MKKQKFFAILLALIGLAAMLEDHDATALVFLLILAVPIFFSKKVWMS